MKRNAYRLSMVLGFLFTFTALFINVNKVHGQSQQSTLIPFTLTSTPTPTPTQTVIPTITATLTFDQQAGDLLATYKEVLDTSQRSIEEVHKTTNELLDFVKTIFVALTIGGLGSATLLSWFGQRASDKANSAQQKAIETLEIIQRTETKSSEIEKRNNLVLESSNELAQKQITLRVQIEAAEKLLHSLEQEFYQLKSSGERDRQVIKKPLTLVQVDEYAMQALSDEPEEKNSSILSLIEMSRRNDAKPDAVIRRKAVKVFGILEEYDERVVKRLKEIIEEDPAQGVRKEAEKSLKLIEMNKKNSGLTS